MNLKNVTQIFRMMADVALSSWIHSYGSKTAFEKFNGIRKNFIIFNAIFSKNKKYLPKMILGIKRETKHNREPEKGMMFGKVRTFQ